MTIRTSYVHPPVPYRHMDWAAVDSDTFDVDFIGGETDEWRANGPIGRGASEAEAIEDLMEQLREAE